MGANSEEKDPIHELLAPHFDSFERLLKAHMQRAYGADIITRLTHALRTPDGRACVRRVMISAP